MLGLILLYWLGKYFYILAEKHNKHKWGFAILGVATYYAGSFIGGILVAIAIAYFQGEYVLDAMSDISLSLIALPFGLGSTWGLYQLLKRKWNREYVPVSNAEILDDLDSL